jgi:hypothetical protein
VKSKIRGHLAVLTILGQLAVLSAPASLSAQDAPGDAGLPAQVQPAPAASPVPVAWKLMRDDAIALEARFGSVLWSGFAWPSGSVATNGINGKNFLYPTIPILGVGVRIGLGQYMRLSPSIDFVFDEYVYRADLDRAFRTQEMTGKSVGPLATVMGIMVGVPLWFDLAVSDRAVFSLAPGVAFYPRFAISALDGSSNIDKITTDLNKDARWLYPQTGLAFHYALTDWFSAGVQIQVMYPIYHLWSSDGLPFYDAMMVTGTIGFDFFF